MKEKRFCGMTMKRIRSAVLALVMVLSLIPFGSMTTFAAPASTFVYDGAWKLDGNSISIHDTLESGTQCTSIAMYGELYVDGTRCYAPYTLTAAAEVIVINGRYLELCTNHVDNGNCVCNTCNRPQITANAAWNDVKSILSGNYVGTFNINDTDYTVKISVLDDSIAIDGADEGTPYHVRTNGGTIDVLYHPDPAAYDGLLNFTVNGTTPVKVVYPTEVGAITCYYIKPIKSVSITSDPLQYVEEGGSVKLVNADGTDAKASDIKLENGANYTVSQICMMEEGSYKMGVALLVPNDGYEFVDGFTLPNGYESGYSSDTENLILDDFTADYFSEFLPDAKPGDVAICWLPSEYTGEIPPVTGDSNNVRGWSLLLMAGLGLLGSLILVDKRRKEELK